MSRYEALKPKFDEQEFSPLNSPLDIVALNGMFDEYDGVGILRTAAPAMTNPNG